MSNHEVSDDELDAAVEAALRADIIPLDAPYEGSPGVRLLDYLEIDVNAAVELGVFLTEKTQDGKPRWHWYSDIRCDEMEDYQRAILRPLIRAALLVDRARA